MWPKYKTNFKMLTKITSISKLGIILLTNNYIFLFYLKMQNALQGSETESISIQVYTRIQGTLYPCTGYPVRTPNFNLIIRFLIKVIFFKIFNCQVLSQNRKPCFAKSAFADFDLHFTLILDSIIF